jgi:hypothetical protein
MVVALHGKKDRGACGCEIYYSGAAMTNLSSSEYPMDSLNDGLEFFKQMASRSRPISRFSVTFEVGRSLFR